MILKTLHKFRRPVQGILLPLFLFTLVNISQDTVQNDNQYQVPEIYGYLDVITAGGLTGTTTVETKINFNVETQLVYNLVECKGELIRSAAYSITVNNESIINFRHYSFIYSHFATST